MGFKYSIRSTQDLRLFFMSGALVIFLICLISVAAMFVVLYWILRVALKTDLCLNIVYAQSFIHKRTLVPWL